MAIREFDLDAPTLPREERSLFRYQTRAVTSIVERFLSKRINIGKSWKILVEVVPIVKFESHRNLIGVLVLQIEGDPSEIFRRAGMAKGEIAVSWLIDGLHKLLKEVGISGVDLADVAKNVRNEKYVSTKIWKGPLKSNDGECIVEILVEIDWESAKVVGIVRRNNGELILKKVLFVDKPDEFVYAPSLGSLRWSESGVAQLFSIDGKKSWDIFQYVSVN